MFYHLAVNLFANRIPIYDRARGIKTTLFAPALISTPRADRIAVDPHVIGDNEYDEF